MFMCIFKTFMYIHLRTYTHEYLFIYKYLNLLICIFKLEIPNAMPHTHTPEAVSNGRLAPPPNVNAGARASLD